LTAEFDIFDIDDSDQAASCGACAGRCIGAGTTTRRNHPGEYFIRSQKTSVEVSMKVNRRLSLCIRDDAAISRLTSPG
jgi:hypothetical protein